MQIPHSSNKKKRLFILIVFIVIVCLTLLSWWYFTQFESRELFNGQSLKTSKSDSKNSARENAAESNTTSSTSQTDQDKSSTLSNPSSPVAQKPKLFTQITETSQSANIIYISNIVQYGQSGSCRLELSRDGTILKSVDVKLNNTTCEPLSLKIDSGSGEYDVTLKVTSGDDVAVDVKKITIR